MAKEHKGKLALDSLLIMPVQRIPRYELLIQVNNFALAFFFSFLYNLDLPSHLLPFLGWKPWTRSYSAYFV